MTTQWYNHSAGTGTPVAAPTGMTTSLRSNLSGIDVISTSSTPVGTYYFRVTMDGVQSNVVTVTVVP